MAYIFLISALLLVSIGAYLLLTREAKADNYVRGRRADVGPVVLMQSGPISRPNKVQKPAGFIGHTNLTPEVVKEKQANQTAPSNIIFPKRSSVEETLSKVTSRIPKSIAQSLESKKTNAQNNSVIEMRVESDLNSDFKPLTAADHLQFFDRFVYALSRLIKDSNERLHDLEQRFISQLSGTNSEFDDNIIAARRIVLALENRLLKLNGLNPHESQEGFFQSKSLLREPLIVPRDAVTALLNASELPPLKPGQWEDAVEGYIGKAERFFEQSSKKVSNL